MKRNLFFTVILLLSALFFSTCNNPSDGDNENQQSNNAPIDIFLTSDIVADNEPSGTVIGELSAQDSDSGDLFRFSLTSGFDDNASFEIDGNTLTTAVTLIHNIKSSYSIEINVNDGTAHFKKGFTIQVSPPVGSYDLGDTNR